jgi:hypothetical protein
MLPSETPNYAHANFTVSLKPYAFSDRTDPTSGLLKPPAKWGQQLPLKLVQESDSSPKMAGANPTSRVRHDVLQETGDRVVRIRDPWPGNVGEMQNVIERAVIVSIGPVLKQASE